MGVLRCNYCGGELEVNAELTVGKCKYCDSLITIPKALDRKGNLYNRAVFLRQNNEFDKAAETYEDILKEDNSDAEAHWGLVLSKYGIEYVVDPKNQERIPTCHRTQAQSILADPDYLAAIEKSDIESRQVIENEAQRIHEIQSRIIALSQKEETYDIFICYKETDERDNRTEDSTIAQEIYYELEKKGYRVFFARKTLESKIGSEYEPIIFAALNSAKVMIVLGTKAEYFNAVWVRNEWSRFQKLSKETSKTIIPVYRSISPYELPAELSALQSLDSTKIGFMQELLDGIERCMRQGDKKNCGSQDIVSVLERRIKNCETYLQLGDFEMAEEVYVLITKDTPEDYRGWWGLIVCKTHNFEMVLKDKEEVLDKWYKYSRNLSNKDEFDDLQKQYMKYKKKCCEVVASNDIKLINKKLEECESIINQKKDEIKKVNSNLEEITKEKERHDYNCRNRIEGMKKSLKEEEKNEKKKKIYLIAEWGIAFWCVLTIGGSGFFFGGFKIVVIIFCAICIHDNGGGIFKRLWSFNDYKNKKSYINQQIDQLYVELDEKDKYFQKNEKEYQWEKQDIEKDILLYNEKIRNGNKYLELGKEKISELWYAKECEAIDVIVPYDKEIEECRQLALGEMKV